MAISKATIENGPQSPSEEVLRRVWSMGHVSLVSTLMVFTFLGWLGRDNPDSPYGETWALILAHFFLGRAGNASVGLEFGFHPVFLMYQAFVQDFIVMCYLYPVFVKGHAWAERIPAVGQRITRLHNLAVARRDRIRPYGVAGLFLFVLFPFWSTGPLVGVLVGYLLGLKTVTSFVTVVIADAIATGAWMLAYDSVRSFSQELAYVILGVLLVVSLGGTLITRFVRRQLKARDAAGEAEAKRGQEPTPQRASL